jgi:hypothetical protein
MKHLIIVVIALFAFQAPVEAQIFEKGKRIVEETARSLYKRDGKNSISAS